MFSGFSLTKTRSGTCYCGTDCNNWSYERWTLSAKANRAVIWKVNGNGRYESRYNTGGCSYNCVNIPTAASTSFDISLAAEKTYTADTWTSLYAIYNNNTYFVGPSSSTLVAGWVC